MESKRAQSNLLLLTTSIIWGFAFVAQRVGMEHVGPFAFNGVRFALGGISLVPLLIHLERTKGNPVGWAQSIPAGLLAGIALFAGASFQQIGIVYTTAGKAGFITGLYVILVPIMGLIWGDRVGITTWIGAVSATVGLYLLSMTGGFTMSPGDLLVLIGAFFWAGHVHIVGFFSPKIGALRLALMQYLTCSALSLVVSGFTETTELHALKSAAAPILYGGIGSVGIAYTLQVVAQKHAHPSHAAIILSLETVFAAIGGRLLLDESMTHRMIAGCILMLFGMLVSQVQWGEKGKLYHSGLK